MNGNYPGPDHVPHWYCSQTGTDVELNPSSLVVCMMPEDNSPKIREKNCLERYDLDQNEHENMMRTL